MVLTYQEINEIDSKLKVFIERDDVFSVADSCKIVKNFNAIRKAAYEVSKESYALAEEYDVDMTKEDNSDQSKEYLQAYNQLMIKTKDVSITLLPPSIFDDMNYKLKDYLAIGFMIDAEEQND